ncbi:MAG: S8 family serine peptidase, partial [Acidimicrobiia bacterium]|nr:S8 family serine peptidase [Acidimicrobiia bacterium]
MEARWRILGVLFLAAAVLVPVSVGAEEPAPVEVSAKPGASGDLIKVSSHLLEARQLAEAGAPRAQIEAATAAAAFSQGHPLLELRFEKLTAETISRIEALGFRTAGAFPQYGTMSGYANLELLDELAAIPEITTIHPAYGYAIFPGDTTSQADVSINADDARTTYGVDGSGVNVGILSDSFNSTLGGSVTGTGCSATVTGMTNQNSGDLPTSVILLDNGAPGTDEGAGMAELVHDLAPGAGIMYHSALPGGEAFFASGITELADCGADVIVDDIVYFAEPMFQDGIVAQAAQDVVDAGVPYFSSAGNNGTYGVMQSYLDSNPGTDDFSFPASGDDFHDFGGGDRFAEVTLGTGEGVRFILQWNDPFSGALGPGSAADLDLHLFDTPDPAATPIASSTNVQGGTVCDGQSGDPLEIMNYVNSTGSEQTVYLAVEHFCGSEVRELRIVTFGSGNSVTALDFEETIFNDAQVYGHAAATGAAAVAAIDYREIDSGGTLEEGSLSVLDVEPFSSLGGDIPFYFDESGNPLPGAPVNRFKPEITAPDGTNTTFFGGSDPEGDSYPNFYGTSAAAPHAAAVAALMLDANPGLTPAEVKNILQGSAVDIESAGIDPLSGYGLVDALAAMGDVPPPDGTPPTWPGGTTLTVSGLMETEATLNWSPAADAARNAGGQTAVVASYRV